MVNCENFLCIWVFKISNNLGAPGPPNRQRGPKFFKGPPKWRAPEYSGGPPDFASRGAPKKITYGMGGEGRVVARKKMWGQCPRGLPQPIGYFLGGSPRGKIRGPPWIFGGPPFGGPPEKFGGPLTIWGPRGPQIITNFKNSYAKEIFTVYDL